MDNIELVKLTPEYKKQLFDMLDEWTSFDSDDPDELTPYAVFKNDYHDFDYYLDNLDIKQPKEDKVPDSCYFLLDKDRNIFLGASNIRHYLNDHLLKYGGHIGDGIRPSERRKGYGSLIIKLSLEKCRELGIKRVLMTCDKNNVASRKTIMNNGGVLENELATDKGEIIQRFWIDL